MSFPFFFLLSFSFIEALSSASMDNKHYFINGGIPPQLQFEPTMPLRFNCASGQSSESNLNPSWDHSTNDQFTQFDSGLSSMVTSPVVASNDGFSIRELIGKLGTVCTSPPPPFAAVTPTNYIMNDSNNISNNSANNSCYSTPINSPPKLHIPNMGNNSPLPALSADPGFAMRAAKFSCFGSRSFNGRTKTTSPFGLNSTELSHRSMANTRPLESIGKLPRVSSSPSLKQDRSSVQQHKNSGQTQMEIGSSATGLGLESEEHSVSKQVPSELNSRKRKAVSRGKTKEDVSKGCVADDCASAKRIKPAEEEEGDGTEDGNVKMEESKGLVSGDEIQKQAMENQTSQEPQKDYIHVRARRGQATDSHSLAERVRREKIGERMKLLQDLVPGCNKVTGKALMLDEIINYVQSLQRQVEFLSMKLASVNPSLDFPVENLLHKDKCQPNGSLSQTMFQVDNSAASAFLAHQQPQQLPQLHTNIPNGSLSQCSVVDPLDTLLCRSLGMQLPSLDGFGENHSQFTTIFEDDLQSIVQMGYTQNPNQDLTLQSQGFPVNNSTSHMKIEM